MRQIWGCSSPASLRLELAWIKGHSEAQGNSKADEEAKAAAEGNISQAQDLPEIFWVKAHPVSSSAMWQAQAAELKAQKQRKKRKKEKKRKGEARARQRK